MTARPFPLPDDLPRIRPLTHLVRAGVATVRSFPTGDAITTAKKMWGRDQTTPLILRGATSPAEIGTAGWAPEITQVAIYDLIASATSISAGAELIDRGLKLDLGRAAELRVPGRALTASAAGSWVSEGQAAPVRALTFANDAILKPRKLEVISVVTNEMAASSNIEAILRQTLEESTGLALDLAMFSSTAANGQPAGLFAGVAPITAAPAGAQAMQTDLGALFGALATHGAGKNVVIVAAAAQAKALEFAAGPKFTTPIITST
jgi:hypothetical protein